MIDSEGRCRKEGCEERGEYGGRWDMWEVEGPLIFENLGLVESFFKFIAKGFVFINPKKY